MQQVTKAMDDNAKQAVEDWLRDWFAEREPDIELGGDENYFDAGVIDSFGTIELIEEIETRFDIRFDERDFQDRRFATLGGLAEVILEKQPVI